MTRVIANGKEHWVNEEATIAEFLSGLGWKPTQVVVERNGEIVPRDRFTIERLRNDDRLEVIVPVAGG